MVYPDGKNMDVVEYNDVKLNILSSTIQHNGNVCKRQYTYSKYNKDKN
ncbi:MAG: hypothetical protein ACLUG9_03855 [Paraclostridium sordellii]|uniref:Uncharacterized protein n=1 Tax=Paraclostridium sordellii TaxID=1505 RepID=A0ABM9RP95_PARSO|nr:hypothetical protein [Paeniclostridium sordellii]EPZ62543.1 response regulator [[Clostridium] sordellii ATCC 9714] [Paeniclostridium sordellii ATCC 9714]MDU2687318.1 hypothetical protein [Paeniclostridium sordellii]MDU6249372.1 hypothetical protein [Paeniclostridium sordellii]CEJ73845.1 hypothetical protein ATCC9714_17331 [[Clostridium] sordellii] [Paeniclostridium sordellii]CEK33685.1 hypothetical protein UMC2_09351 [[Clostridium] sordellii] [Paeniclostridium sordellii]